MRTVRRTTAASGLLLAGSLLVASPASADHGYDLDCADFATQAEAQAHFLAHPGDPDGLDADDDGIACETYFGGGSATVPSGEEDQMAAMPQGGVATGGGSTAGPENLGLIAAGGLAVLVGTGGLVVARRQAR